MLGYITILGTHVLLDLMYALINSRKIYRNVIGVKVFKCIVSG
jgi:uncharacterized membrane protein